MTTAVHNGNGPAPPAEVDGSENPLHRLTAEQIEQLGREFDELHEQVKADLGERDARYIRSMIVLQRRLALLGRAELIASRWRIPWLLGASTGPYYGPRYRGSGERNAPNAFTSDTVPADANRN